MGERFFQFSLFSKFPEIIHGISNRQYGDMRFGKLKNEEVIKNRRHFVDELGIDLGDVTVADLIHLNKIVTIGKNERGRGSIDPKSAISGTDGLITKEKGIFLMLTFADCFPILIYEPTTQIVAIIHAGWRGIIRGIIPQVIEKMKNLGAESQSLFVGVGPGICQRHFVVKNDVLGQFQESFPKTVFVRNTDGYVDLKKAVLDDFFKLGLPKGNIEDSNICTACQNGIYGSFRKEGDSVIKQAAIIGVKEIL